MAHHAAVEWLARTGDVQVRVMTLATGDGTPWHYHRHVSDDIFALDDGIEVALRDPGEVSSLRPGQRVHVAPGRVHRVSNPGRSPARYLLVQGTGAYDFNEVE